MEPGLPQIFEAKMASPQEDLATRKSQLEKAKTDLDAEALR